MVKGLNYQIFKEYIITFVDTAMFSSPIFVTLNTVSSEKVIIQIL
jgi:hypothetical protein